MFHCLQNSTTKKGITRSTTWFPRYEILEIRSQLGKRIRMPRAEEGPVSAQSAQIGHLIFHRKRSQYRELLELRSMRERDIRVESIDRRSLCLPPAFWLTRTQVTANQFDVE